MYGSKVVIFISFGLMQKILMEILSYGHDKMLLILLESLAALRAGFVMNTILGILACMRKEKLVSKDGVLMAKISKMPKSTNLTLVCLKEEWTEGLTTIVNITTILRNAMIC